MGNLIARKDVTEDEVRIADFRLLALSGVPRKGAKVAVNNLTGFAEACQEAMNAVLDAIATVGEERWRHLTDAKRAVGRAQHDARTGEAWYFAEQLRRGIRDVEVRAQHAA